MLRADAEFPRELVPMFNCNEAGFGGFLFQSPSSQKTIPYILHDEDGV